MDAVLTINESFGVYDISFGNDGDILTDEFFDTAILYSIFGERRSSSDEVLEPTMRRGWIGNDSDFENGSKLWLYEKSRQTRSVLNSIQDEAKKALEWMVEDGIAVSVGDPVATVSKGKTILTVEIFRSRDNVIRRNFMLWENTPRAA